MNALTTGRVPQVLNILQEDAATSDRDFIEALGKQAAASEGGIEAMIGKLLEKDRADYKTLTQVNSERFLAVSPECGRFLYMVARMQKASRIVEFGTSMGISTIFLAAALRDNGGGQLIGSDLVPLKVARARKSIEMAGLTDLVEIREGDAMETLRDLQGDIDMVFLDGAFSLYLPVLKLLEGKLRSGAVVFGENAFDPEYLAYVRDPANGYISQALAIGEARGNELSVRVL